MTRMPICLDSINSAASDVLDDDLAETLVMRYFGVSFRVVENTKYASLLPDIKMVANVMDAVSYGERGRVFRNDLFRRLMRACVVAFGKNTTAVAMYALINSSVTLHSVVNASPREMVRLLKLMRSEFSPDDEWQDYIGVTLIVSQAGTLTSFGTLSRISEVDDIWRTHSSETIAAMSQYVEAGVAVNDALFAIEHGIDIEMTKASIPVAS